MSTASGSSRSSRSELATPASNDWMFAKAAAGADLVFLDLEDASAPAERESARGKAATALRDWTGAQPPVPSG